ncbi:hypothetical protein [Alkalihalobacillus sp. AL-G]|uniref:DUF6843 domain-containing protein n=1 Tax=Alkalihalobacillus sp. AL-G TaxID=2926399 RepID=UPI00272CA5B6|nr:hypothetical protein [Alkalihalobacillus sp. AL-G]WLD94232.1 hypothetical protein MOJ78_04895 [Alkalihalobacillus sp. AL-G]
MQLSFLWRKFLSALATSIMTTAFFVIAGIIGDGYEAISWGLIYFVFVTIAIVIYGLPVSIVADIVIPNTARFSWFYSILIHVGFVIIPLGIMNLIVPRAEVLNYLALITPIAFLFALIDTILKRRNESWRFERKIKSIFGYGAGATLLIIGCLVWFFQGTIDQQPPLTHYYIPEGHKGWVYIFYGDPEHTPLEATEDKRIIRVNEKGVAKTSSLLNGGSLKDKKYFYIMEKGLKEKIPADQVHFVGVSDYSYTGAEVSVYYDIEKIFIGTDTEFLNRIQPNVVPLIELPDPDRDPRKIYIPNGYTGWVKVRTGDKAGIIAGTSVQIDQDGNGTVPFHDISFSSHYDHFFYKSSKELTRIPEEKLSEIYYYPELIVFYVGPKEDFQQHEPFDYAEYLQNS